MALDCELLTLDLPHAERIRSRMPEREALAAASELGKALSEPNRLAIVAALTGGEELCGCDLGWIVALPQNLVSHHLRVLSRAGVTNTRRDGKKIMHKLTERGESIYGALGGDRLDAPVIPT